MRARSTLRPGQPGTKKLHAQYGDHLLYVRYRYDHVHGKRYKTVEIIVDEASWAPLPPPPDMLVSVRVIWGEVALAKQIKDAGGTWNRTHKVWTLAYRMVEQLGILDRMVERDIRE